MIVAVKIIDNLCRFEWVAGDREEAEVLTGDHAALQQDLLDKIKPGFPVAAVIVIDQDQGDRRVLAGLHQGQRFHGLIQCAKATWEESHRLSFFQKSHFPVEKILVGDGMAAVFHDRVGALLKG